MMLGDGRRPRHAAWYGGSRPVTVMARNLVLERDGLSTDKQATSDQNELKRSAGYRAAELAADGMVLGLGSGSTARYATLRIAERLREGSLRDIVAVPTSDETARLAHAEGIPLIDLGELVEQQAGKCSGEAWVIDLTIDGADEVDPQLNVIKGLGGFLLREKIVASATRHEVIVVDGSKLVSALGSRSPVPVEVVQFGWQHVRRALERTGAATSLRLANGQLYVTDEGHHIIDCRYAPIADPETLAATLQAIPGVVGHGLFLGMVQTVIVASDGQLHVMEK